MSETPFLGLPLVAAGQAQKHVTINEALARLDAVAQIGVIDRRAAPPSEPEEGDRHIVAATASGAWTGWEGSVAAFLGGGWLRLAPSAGWCALVADEAVMLCFDGADWTPVGALLGGIGELPSLGVGTASDEVNTFAAKLNAALWTARAAGEGGTGDLRYVMNKEGASDVLSLLLQSGYEGRAELGLVGDDDLVLKVSPDGETWHEAFRVDRTTGEVDFPSGGSGIGGGGGGGGDGGGGGGSSDDLELTVALLALRQSIGVGTGLMLGTSFADSLNSLAHVDVAGATNLDSGTAGVLKPTTAAGTDAVPAMAGNATPSGTVAATSVYAGGFDAWYAFDNVTAGVNCWLSSAVPTGGAPQEISYDFGTNTAIGSYTVRSASSSAVANHAERAPNAWTLDGWNGSAWTTLDTRTGQTGWGNAEQRAFTLAATASGYSKYRLRVTASNGGATGVAIGEIEFRGPAGIDNVTVRSAALDFGFVPAALRLTARLKKPAGFTLNTDATLEVSRDDGGTWTGAALTSAATEPDDIIVVRSAYVDVTGQPSGASVRWRWKTLTNKAVELHDVHVTARA